jgi:hypothetical protein
LRALRFNSVTLFTRSKGTSTFTKNRTTTLLEIFITLAPQLMLVERPLERVMRTLAIDVGRIRPTTLNKVPVPTNTTKQWLADFVALGLMAHSRNEDDESWSLTEYGRDVFARYRRAILEDVAVKEPSASTPANETI